MTKRFLSLLMIASILVSMFMVSPTDALAAKEGVFTYTIENGEATITDCDTSVSGSLEIPSTLGGCSVTVIEKNAFEYCTSLTNITIPDSVTTIGNYAFYHCKRLTNITIPDSVTTIGKSAFDGCTSLTNITIPNSVTTIGDGAFGYCTSLTNITIPNSVTTIGKYAFDNCTSLTNITIPDSVTTIGSSAFRDCASLTNITIPDSVTTIGDYAFRDCIRLTNITIPDSVTTIGNYAFDHCIRLTNITIPDSVTTIGNYAFDHCTRLTNITIPDSVTTIGKYAFYDCTSLTNITIPNSVTTIGKSAFCRCTSLTNITIPDSVTTIGGSAFSTCTSLTNITIPDSVTTIGGKVFYDCTSLTNITIPDSVTTIGDYAFEHCTSLTNITIPDSVTTIGKYAFYDCTSLTNITIPDSVTTIGDGAFNDCNSLTNITIPDSVTTIGKYAFEYCTSLTNITIPDSVTTIGNGAFLGCTSLTNITIPDSVTTIGNYAFSRCTSLTNITIPDSVTTIGDYAFYDCTSLTNITIPDSVTTIGNYAFEYCTNLTNITIPDSVTTIGKYAFYDCTSLTNVYYTGSKVDWEKISIGSDNENLTNATIHYNYRYSENICLSENVVTAYVNKSKKIYVYQGDGVTPCKKILVAGSSDKSVVTTSVTNNEVTLTFHKMGEADITVLAADGSGARATCKVTVSEMVENEETYLLTRLALSRYVYSNNLMVYDLEELKERNVIGHKEQKANKNTTMYYLDSKNTVKWGEFFKQYINDYEILSHSRNAQNGFYAAAFESPKGDIIIAYRGTEPSQLNDLATDVEMFTGYLNGQFDDALSFYDEVASENPDKNITLTGHSLGGALASYVAINRGVRCDNINGATGWLFTNAVVKATDKRLLAYKGFDEYVHENFNEQNDLLKNFKILGNYTITQLAKKGAFNYKKYKNTKNYNKKSKDELIKDYHSITSIINYDDNSFALTDKTEDYTVNRYKEIDGYLFLGTTGNDSIRKGGSVSNFLFSANECMALCGDGDDTVNFTISGDDTLIGNSGDDTLNGGNGDDLYVFAGNWGNDTVYDPAGKDIIQLTDVTYGDYSIEYDDEYVLISSGNNSIKVVTKVRKKNITLLDMDGNVLTIKCGGANLSSIDTTETDTTPAIKISGNMVVEIYNDNGDLIETITVNEDTNESMEYKDYGMVSISTEGLDLILCGPEYIVKITSDEVVSVCAVSDADNPTVAKQTFVENQDLSDGSAIVIDTRERAEEQLSVKLVRENEEHTLYSEAPENFTIIADKTAIKTGEAITMSVPEIFADSVVWECTNNNVIISKNEDLSVSVIGYTPGEETVRVYLPNDELYSAEFSFEITQDSAPEVSVTSNDEIYDGSTMATDDVIFDVVIPDGYDKVVLDTFTPYAQVEDTNTFIVNSVGDQSISIYCQNSETGARTHAFTFKFSQDSEAPVISGVEDGGVYYIDRIIEIYDTELGSIYLNNELCDSDTLTVSEVGSYTIIAADVAGNKKEISFEIKDIALLSVRNESDGELISEIRKDFERTKYSFSEERMNSFEATISALEDTVNKLPKIADFEAEASGDNIVVSVGLKNIPDDAIVIAVSYVDDKIAEVKKLVSEDGIYKGTFPSADVSKFRVFAWNSSVMPIAKSKEYTYSEI